MTSVYAHDDVEAEAVAALGLDCGALAALAEALADREAEEGAPDDSAAEAVDDGLAAASARRVSARAFDLIVRHETGGRAYYDQIIKGRPEWPGGGSGLTIGFGYDLGYASAGDFSRDWAVLSAEARALLSPGIGRHGGNAGAAAMRALRDATRPHLVVGWDVAARVFAETTLPRYAEMTRRALPNAEALSGDAFGALVSLTFNRGPSYRKDGARYAEMREILDAMRGRRFARIPTLIRAMRRIWIGTAIETEMLRRRENEALLFEAGLAATAPLALAAPAVVASAAEGMAAGERDEELLHTVVTEEDVVAAAEGADDADGALEAAALGADSARWAADAHAPDYAHLGEGSRDVAFELRPEDLELLAAMNDFSLGGDETPVLFGLRGCAIIRAGDRVATLRDQRPDHLTPRCVIGAWDRRGGRIAVFAGSTVPDRRAVASWRATRRAGNLLPTGLYGYIVGPHATVGRDGRTRSRPGCFLLRESMGEKREVIVRRSADDLCYEAGDLIDRTRPGDNIHPSFFSAPSDFSSFGCQTVVGMADEGGNHTGPWAEFRRAAGMTTPGGVVGTPYRYMLLTGAEARRAAELRRAGLAGDAPSLRGLRRLRFGSRGGAVARLQARLRLPGADGAFGPATAEALHDFERGMKGGSTGVYTPTLDAALGWGVMSAMGV